MAARDRAGAAPFELSGGALCLDFANTVSDRPTADRRERLTAYSDLVSWSRQARAIDSRAAARLLTRSRARPAEAAAVLRRAIDLREVIYRVFSVIAARRVPHARDLDRLNAHLKACLRRSRIAMEGGAFRWTDDEDGALDRPLWAVARSAADLLTSPARASVGECAARDCGWLFIDETRNRSRRWCDMAVCGNREKARRFRERHASRSG